MSTTEQAIQIPAQVASYLRVHHCVAIAKRRDWTGEAWTSHVR